MQIRPPQELVDSAAKYKIAVIQRFADHQAADAEFARVGHRSVSDARARIASKRPDLADCFTTAKLGRLGAPSIVADARGCIAVLSAVPATRWTARAIEYLQTLCGS